MKKDNVNINQKIWNHLCWKRQHLLAISFIQLFKKQEMTEIKKRITLQSQDDVKEKMPMNIYAYSKNEYFPTLKYTFNRTKHSY